MSLPNGIQFIGYVTRVGFDREGAGLFFPTFWTATMDPGDGLPVEGVFDVSGIQVPATEQQIVDGIKAALASHLSELFSETVDPSVIIGCYPA